MKGYMNQIAADLLQTVALDVRDKAVEFRTAARTRLAITMLEKDPSLRVPVRFSPSAVLDGVAIHAIPNTLIVWSYGVVGAIGMPLTDPETGELKDDAMDVYYDTTFKQLPPRVMDAILAHEVGHMKLGHNRRLAEGWKPTAEEAFEMECEADAYAFAQGYDMRTALQVIAYNYRKSFKLNKLKELRQRMDRLHMLQLEKDFTSNDPKVPFILTGIELERTNRNPSLEYATEAKIIHI